MSSLNTFIPFSAPTVQVSGILPSDPKNNLLPLQGLLQINDGVAVPDLSAFGNSAGIASTNLAKYGIICSSMGLNLDNGQTRQIADLTHMTAGGIMINVANIAGANNSTFLMGSMVIVLSDNNSTILCNGYGDGALRTVNAGHPDYVNAPVLVLTINNKILSITNNGANGGLYYSIIKIF